ncbi:hypothetical protein FGO68_gene13778 [Halteria grandinella]|uniref:Uncharacterized protein n=1 Tax=Halteria grandinella TaxID=5974 RepID=A0A8J8NWN0_HALGN|nr:hypothetical protein FGO68_gene13778 [Halteria grandinella]
MVLSPKKVLICPARSHYQGRALITILLIFALSLTHTSAIHWSELITGDQEEPIITWPTRFETVLSTHDSGINITEVVYFDGFSGRVRLQTYYSILGLEASKGLDITIDERNKVIALRTDTDCKYTRFNQSLSAITLFFKLWNAFTVYKGIEDGQLAQVLTETLRQHKIKANSIAQFLLLL